MIRALIPWLLWNKDVKSPQLDRLADDGMVFDRHYDTNVSVWPRGHRS